MGFSYAQYSFLSCTKRHLTDLVLFVAKVERKVLAIVGIELNGVASKVAMIDDGNVSDEMYVK